MKFYTTFAALISLIFSFSCYTSQTETDRNGSISSESFVIPVELCCFFDQSIKLQLPENSRTAIIAICKKQTENTAEIEKKVEQLIEPVVTDLQNQITQLKKEKEKITQQHMDLKKDYNYIAQQQKLLEKKIALEKQRLAQEKRKKLAQITNDPEKKVSQTVEKKPKKKLQSIAQQLAKVHKSLRFQYNAKSYEELIEALQKKCEFLFIKKDINIPSMGVYFDESRKLLMGHINKEWMFFFGYCSQVLLLNKTSYPCSENQINIIAKTIICDEPSCCRINENSMQNEDSSTDSDTESTESNIDIMISKQTMEKF